MAVEQINEIDERRTLLLPPDAPAERFEPLAGFVDIWRAKRASGRLPAWRNFDFYDFVGWHGYVYVDQVVARDPLEMRCRLWGIELTELLGFDETGKLFSESPAAAAPGRLEINSRVVGEGLVCLMSGRAVAWGTHTLFTVVKLSCADDGVTVDHILGCAWPIHAAGC